jgi:uncharacterized protein with PQ loop repeat
MGFTDMAGTVATIVFAASHLPMLRKAIRTRDVRSYSVTNLALVNVANILYSFYVFTLPLGPVWALHSFYFVTAAIMFGLCWHVQRRGGRGRAGAAHRGGPLVDGARGEERWAQHTTR